MMGTLAIGELKACMRDLGLDVSRMSRYFRRASVINNLTGDRGPTRVVFKIGGKNGGAPQLELARTIRGLGINGCVFEPSVLEMVTYDERKKALRITGTDYDFTLKF